METLFTGTLVNAFKRVHQDKNGKEFIRFSVLLDSTDSEKTNEQEGRKKEQEVGPVSGYAYCTDLVNAEPGTRIYLLGNQKVDGGGMFVRSWFPDQSTEKGLKALLNMIPELSAAARKSILKQHGEKTAALLDENAFDIFLKALIPAEASKKETLQKNRFQSGGGGILKTQAYLAAERWNSMKELRLSRNAELLLIQHGLTHRAAQRIVEKMGARLSIQKLLESPYRLVPLMRFADADRIAQRTASTSASPHSWKKSSERLQVGIPEVLLDSLRSSGHCYIALPAAIREAACVLEVDEPTAASVLQKILATVSLVQKRKEDENESSRKEPPAGSVKEESLAPFSDPVEGAQEFLADEDDYANSSMNRKLVYGCDWVGKGIVSIHTKATFECEWRIASILCNLKNRQGLYSRTEDREELRRNLSDEKFASLTEEQKSALENVFVSRVSIITGGPGTGKSRIVSCVHEILLHLNAFRKKSTLLSLENGGELAGSTCLLAPTGIAAKNIGGDTIHLKMYQSVCTRPVCNRTECRCSCHYKEEKEKQSTDSECPSTPSTVPRRKTKKEDLAEEEEIKSIATDERKEEFLEKTKYLEAKCKSCNKIINDPHDGLPLCTHPWARGIVIIDEFSMVDTYLMAALLRCVDLPRAHLVFVGDMDQLPSVGCGSLFRDVLPHFPVTRLTKNFRVTCSDPFQNLIRTFECVREGKIEWFSKPKSLKVFLSKNEDSQKKVPSSPIEWVLATDEELEDAVEEIVKQKIRSTASSSSGCVAKEGEKHSSFDIPQIISPFNTKVNRINQRVQALVNPPDPKKPEVALAGGVTLRVGDKVIITKNDYKRGVFNGDMGIIDSIMISLTDRMKTTVKLQISAEENPKKRKIQKEEIQKGGDKEKKDTEGEEKDIEGTEEESETFRTVSWVVRDLSSGELLKHAYAITVHKAQGSEFPEVIFAMPRFFLRAGSFSPITRSHVYTAITRAKNRCIVVMEGGTIDHVVRAVRSSIQERNTTLQFFMKEEKNEDQK